MLASRSRDERQQQVDERQHEQRRRGRVGGGDRGEQADGEEQHVDPVDHPQVAQHGTHRHAVG